MKKDRFFGFFGVVLGIISSLLLMSVQSIDANGYVEFKTSNGRIGGRIEICDFHFERGRLFIRGCLDSRSREISLIKVRRMIFDGASVLSNLSGRRGRRSSTPNYSRFRNSTPSSNRNFDEIIEQTSKIHGVRTSLVHALIDMESGYNPNARSAKGAMGVMQLMPSTARDLGVINPYDPEENIEAGIRHLGDLLRRLQGNERLALAAYHTGLGRVERCRCIPSGDDDNMSTQQYVNRVMRLSND